jgi:hypothetical protein
VEGQVLPPSDRLSPAVVAYGWGLGGGELEGVEDSREASRGKRLKTSQEEAHNQPRISLVQN